MPYCPRCGVDNPASARFCDQCGAALIPVAAQPAPSPAPIPARPMPAPTPQRTASVAPLNGGAINCAQCGASAMPGEAFCDNCGAPLQAPAPQVATPPPPAPGLVPQASFPAPQASFPAPPAYTPPVAAPSYTPPVVQTAPTPPAPVRTSLAPARLLLDSGVELGLPGVAQALIGRADAVSNFAPEIDLGGHGAVESGVGRRHARLFLQNGQVMLEDLNSTNGTTLNSQRLKPNQPQAIHDGDTFLLGSMRMRFSQ